MDPQPTGKPDLQEYAWGQTVPETTAALNLAVQNVKDGVQVTWQVYSPEETEVDPSLGCVQLFYFPGERSRWQICDRDGRQCADHQRHIWRGPADSVETA